MSRGRVAVANVTIDEGDPQRFVWDPWWALWGLTIRVADTHWWDWAFDLRMAQHIFRVLAYALAGYTGQRVRHMAGRDAPPALARVMCQQVPVPRARPAPASFGRHIPAENLRWPQLTRAGRINPATRNRTRDHLIAAAIYSQMLYQLSYSRSRDD